MNTIHEYSEVQSIAKKIFGKLPSTLTAVDSEQSIALRATALLAEYGIEETWYYNCPAFVLLGSRSCLSISGREYIPSQEPVGQFNVVTVDLSPLMNGKWGDCARTFLVENGVCTSNPMKTEFKRGIEVESLLHKSMQSFVSPDTTFEELFAFGNAEIRRLGFENLDFLGNLGHSIATRREDRLYIEPENRTTLGSVPFFTFEPHIREVGGLWGFKQEDIYYFDAERCLRVL